MLVVCLVFCSDGIRSKCIVLLKNNVIILMHSMYVFNRDVSSHLNYDHRVFNSQEFLKSREPAEELFYKTVNTNKVLFCDILV